MKYFRFLFLALILLGATAPALAATNFEVSGWIPYWKAKDGAKDATRHLSAITEINPFGFSVKNDGSLSDTLKIKKNPWTKLIKEAKKKRVLVVPTVMWSDGAATHQILSNPDLRAKHVKAITEMVKKGKYDGVDINYEGKLAATREGYSAFLTELDKALGNKYLSCTIEARTPPDSLYTTPREIQYVNDFSVIGRVCDRVKIMTYDQQRADLKLNAKYKNIPYAPVSDSEWVRKVMTLTAETIPKEKLMLGIPTYGHEFEVIATPSGLTDYAKVWALNPKYGEDQAKKHKIKIGRSEANEASFTYWPDKSTFAGNDTKVSRGVPDHNLVAKQALAYAKETGQRIPFYFVTWSDAEAVEDKVLLAKELGLAGVAFFKFDGGEDRDIWDLL